MAFGSLVWKGEMGVLGGLVFFYGVKREGSWIWYSLDAPLESLFIYFFARDLFFLGLKCSS